MAASSDVGVPWAESIGAIGYTLPAAALVFGIVLSNTGSILKDQQELTDVNKQAMKIAAYSFAGVIVVAAASQSVVPFAASAVLMGGVLWWYDRYIV